MVFSKRYSLLFTITLYSLLFTRYLGFLEILIFCHFIRPQSWNFKDFPDFSLKKHQFFCINRPTLRDLQSPRPWNLAKLLHLWYFPNVTWEFWKFWFFAILWAREIPKLTKMTKIWTSRARKMAKNQNFQKSQITFGKYHKWSNLAKMLGSGT